MDLVNAYVIAIFESRKRGFTQPDGTSDDKDRWFPSEKEDADGDGSFTYPPTPKRPYTYLERCKTRKHVKLLVHRAILGLPVPGDISSTMGRVYQLFQKTGMVPQQDALMAVSASAGSGAHVAVRATGATPTKKAS
jgi:hypothetical protein